MTVMEKVFQNASNQWCYAKQCVRALPHFIQMSVPMNLLHRSKW